MSRTQYLIVGALLVVHLTITMGLFALPTSSRPPPDWLSAVGYGWIFAQISLLATWTALASTRESLLRLPWALLYLVLLWLGYVANLRWHDSWFLTLFALLSGLAISWGFLLALGLLHLASRLSRWRLTLVRKEDAQLAAAGQFRIRQVLMLTSGIAAVLGIARWVLPTKGWEMIDLSPEVYQGVLVFTVLTLANTLLIVPVCAWVASLNHGPTSVFIFLAWPAYAMLVTIAEIGLYIVLTEDSSFDGEFQYQIIMNITQGVCLFASLLVLRAAGWRVARCAKPLPHS